MLTPKTVDYVWGFIGSVIIILTGILMVLKLGGIIGWCWIWVLSPIWIPLGIIMLVLVIAIVGFIKYVQQN